MNCPIDHTPTAARNDNGDDVPMPVDPNAVPESPFSGQVARYADALGKFKSMVLARLDLSVILQAVCQEIVRTVPTADMVGITVLREGHAHPETVASTDPRVNDVDADQYRTDQGPCLEAARTRHMVRVRVEDTAVRWPLFAAAVAGLGVQSYLSAPLTLDERHLGAINIYSYDPHGFGDIDEALVRLYVMAVETAVLVSRRAHRAEDEVTGLTTAMDTRARIEQAKGIIMAMRGVDADTAFAILSAQSQNRNVKVNEIAASLIASVNAAAT